MTVKLTATQGLVVDLLRRKGGEANRYEIQDALPPQTRGRYEAESYPFPTQTVEALERHGLVKVRREQGWVMSCELVEVKP